MGERIVARPVDMRMTQEYLSGEHTPFGMWRFLGRIERALLSIHRSNPQNERTSQEHLGELDTPDRAPARRALEVIAVAADHAMLVLEDALRTDDWVAGEKRAVPSEGHDYAWVVHESLGLVEMMIPGVILDDDAIFELARPRLAAYTRPELRRIWCEMTLVILTIELFTLELEETSRQSPTPPTQIRRSSPRAPDERPGSDLS